MVIDAGIVVIMVAAAVRGYCLGLTRGAASLATLAVSVLLALQCSDDLARLFLSNSDVPPGSVIFCFLLILAAEWSALFGMQKWLGRALDSLNDCWLDQFAGGVGGLCLGIAGAWLGVAVVVGAFPQTLPVIERSTASMRLLAVSGMPQTCRDEAGPAGDSLDYKCVAEHSTAFRTY